MSLADIYLDYAAILATITYTLGGLLFMLPIPVHGVKKWGQNMIKDGIYATFLAAIYKFILSITKIIMGMLHISWQSYILTLTAEELAVGGAYIFLSSLLSLESFFSSIPILGTIVSIVGGKEFIKGLASSLGATLQFITMLYAFSVFIEFTAPLLIAIGIMFMALPFRIGKDAGAFLISFSLVLYVGLPFLPTFDSIIFGVMFQGQSMYEMLASIIATSIISLNLLTSVIPLLQLYVTISTVYIGFLLAVAYGIAELILSRSLPFEINLF